MSKVIKLRQLGDSGQAQHSNAAGMEPMRSLVQRQIGLAQDRLAASSRRILMWGGLQGGDGWLVPDAEDVSNPKTPDAETPYTVAGPLTFELNPGCILAMRALWWPATYTSYYDGSVYGIAGAAGTIRTDITWTSGDTGSTTSEHFIETHVSPGDGVAPPATYDGWGEIREGWIAMAPDGWAVDKAVTEKYGYPGTTAQVEVQFLGSPRIIYWCVYELPHEIVREFADAQGAYHGFTDAQGHPLESPPSQWPVTELDATNDDSGGSLATLEATEQFATATRGGGIYWRAGGGHTTTVADVVSLGPSGTGSDEYPPDSITSSTFGNILKNSDTEWASTAPGFGASQIAYCAGYDASQITGTRAVRCKVSVRWKVSAGTGTLRVQTAPHSYVDLETASTTTVTTEAIYRFDVGLSPWDRTNFQMFAKQTSGTMSLYDVAIVPEPGD